MSESEHYGDLDVLFTNGLPREWVENVHIDRVTVDVALSGFVIHDGRIVGPQKQLFSARIELRALNNYAFSVGAYHLNGFEAWHIEEVRRSRGTDIIRVKIIGEWQVDASGDGDEG